MAVTSGDPTNRNNAARTVSARPYILLCDGTYLFGGVGQRSLRQQVELIDPSWEGLTDLQQAGLVQMYARFEPVMAYWNIPTVIQKAN